MKKYFFNAIAPFLLQIRWRKSKLSLFKNNILQKKLYSRIPVLEIEGKKDYKILIGSIRSQAHSLLFEGAIGLTFRKAGFHVSTLRCGQYLKSCETKSHFKDNQMACSMCHKEFDYFKKVFRLDEITYDELIDSELKKEILQFINHIKLNKFDKWKGFSLQNEWKCALQRYYLSTETKIEEKPDIAKSFLFSVIASFEVGKTLVKKYGYTHLFTSHGIYSTWGGLVAGFREAGGDVTVWGRGYYKSGIVSFKNESYLNGLKYFDRTIVEKYLNPKYIDDVKFYLESKWKLINNNDSVNYYKNHKNHKNKDILNLKEDIYYISFFPNIPWDAQAFVSTKNYKSLTDVLESLIKYTKIQKNTHVIIRPHPAENPKRDY